MGLPEDNLFLKIQLTGCGWSASDKPEQKKLLQELAGVVRDYVKQRREKGDYRFESPSVKTIMITTCRTIDSLHFIPD